MLHQVFRIPELLSIIFGHTDERTNAVCAIVCKDWLDPALNELWRYVEDPIILFKLLAPMHVISVASDETRRWIFSRFVLPSDWPRFQYYACRVRCLDHREVSSPQWIDASVYAEVARTRPSLIILPNLWRLIWHTKLLHQAILFMHPNLTHLIARIDEPFLAEEGFLEARAFLVDAAARLPNLVLLDIRASFSVINVQAALVHLFQSALHLKQLILPRYWLTSSIISALAGSPRLEVVQWEYMVQGEGDPKDVESFKVVTHLGAFPALKDLSLEVNLPDAAELIVSPSLPDRLTTLYIQSLHFTPPPQIQHFLTLCSTNCHAITYLYLDLHVNNPKFAQEAPWITLETLEPLLSCPNLLQFMLNYNQPLSITDSDVETMARRWPSLVTLYLNYEPVILTTPQLTLAALLPFAEHCPNLEELGLYIDATIPAPAISDARPFTRLRNLHIGTSPIIETNAVALFLSRLCPSSQPRSSAPVAIELSFWVSWDPVLKAALDKQVWQEIEARRSIWKSVQAYLPMLLALRTEERSRSKQLEDELEKLRSRNHALELRATAVPARREMREEF